MDLCNPTGDTLNGMFDSVSYIFAPRSVITLPDEAGRHVAAALAKYGLVEVHFGDDSGKIRYAGLRARVMYYRQILEGHELVNTRQAELKFPPIVESDAVKQARIALPIYEKALGKIELQIGVDRAAAYAKELETMLNEIDVKLPELKDATLTQMRDEATRLGIEWQPGWNYIELREAIESHKAVSELAPVPVTPTSPTSASGMNVVPGPDPNMAPDELAGGPFSRI